MSFIRLMPFFSVVLLLILSGCSTPPKGARLISDIDELPSIQSEKSSVLDNVMIGMTVEEFKKNVPSAYIAGQSDDTTAYELVHVQKYVTYKDISNHNLLWGVGSPRAKSRKQALWFYFYDKKLVQWGEPQDWPKKADFIIEKRLK